jgi:hypothetical protein
MKNKKTAFIIICVLATTINLVACNSEKEHSTLSTVIETTFETKFFDNETETKAENTTVTTETFEFETEKAPELQFHEVYDFPLFEGATPINPKYIDEKSEFIGEAFTVKDVKKILEKYTEYILVVNGGLVLNGKNLLVIGASSSEPSDYVIVEETFNTDEKLRKYLGSFMSEGFYDRELSMLMFFNVNGKLCLNLNAGGKGLRMFTDRITLKKSDGKTAEFVIETEWYANEKGDDITVVFKNTQTGWKIDSVSPKL